MAGAEVLIIGVDGGATEVKAHAVARGDPSRATSFALRDEAASRTYPRVPGFTPLPAAEQLAQRDAGRIQLSPAEIEQGQVWVRAASAAIAEVASQCAARRLLVGIGMPGLKTANRRGIAVINNGPRIPDYLAALERGLAAGGLELVSPIAALGSDADYCGLGEEYAAEGLFRDVENAYYVGGGTGLADALKLRGQLVPFDGARSWILKSWQMPSALGPTFEQLVSAASINRSYRAVHPRPATVYPEQAALQGEPLAIAQLDTAARVLAELIFERLWTIKNGRPDTPHRGDAYARLDPAHEYRGVLLDRVVIGQRVGMIYGAPTCRPFFGDKLDEYLAAFIAGCGDTEMASACLSFTGERSTPPSLKPGLIRASRLRAAPALGAGIAAVRARQS